MKQSLWLMIMRFMPSLSYKSMISSKNIFKFSFESYCVTCMTTNPKRRLKFHNILECGVCNLLCYSIKQLVAMLWAMVRY